MASPPPAYASLQDSLLSPNGVELAAQQQQRASPPQEVSEGGQAMEGDDELQVDPWLASSLHSLLVAGTEAFYSQTAGSQAQAIAKGAAEMQQEAAALAERAESERAGVLAELARLHKLVSAFHTEISAALTQP